MKIEWKRIQRIITNIGWGFLFTGFALFFLITEDILKISLSIINYVGFLMLLMMVLGTLLIIGSLFLWSLDLNWFLKCFVWLLLIMLFLAIILPIPGECMETSGDIGYCWSYYPDEPEYWQKVIETVTLQESNTEWRLFGFNHLFFRGLGDLF